MATKVSTHWRAKRERIKRTRKGRGRVKVHGVWFLLLGSLVFGCAAEAGAGTYPEFHAGQYATTETASYGSTNLTVHHQVNRTRLPYRAGFAAEGVDLVRMAWRAEQNPAPDAVDRCFADITIHVVADEWLDTYYGGHVFGYTPPTTKTYGGWAFVVRERLWREDPWNIVIHEAIHIAQLCAGVDYSESDHPRPEHWGRDGLEGQLVTHARAMFRHCGHARCDY